MNFLQRIADSLIGVAVVALLAAEFEVSSYFGNWQPTHQTAMAIALISIAMSVANQNDPTARGSGQAR